jgi:hypothetical protein
VTTTLKKERPTLSREQVAYALSTHLCYSGVRPNDKAIDVFIQRFESYTPEAEQQRQDDLQEAYDEYMAAQVGVVTSTTEARSPHPYDTRALTDDQRSASDSTPEQP